MDNNRVALISIIVADKNSVAAINDYLHQYSDYIIGRMGIPYKRKKISIISVAIDAPNDIISALAGKLGNLSGVNTKTIYN
jgi:putative iron-only hydrogenase system regulator